MTASVRIAMTQTRNAYSPMPERVEDLPRLAGQLEAIREANVAHHVALIEEAARQGARVVGLGELFTSPYFALERRDMWLPMAEDAREGPTIRTLRDVAARLGVVLIAPIYELDTETGERFNTAVIIDDDGRWCGRYRKTHIPCGTNEQGEFHETHYYGPPTGPHSLTMSRCSVTIPTSRSSPRRPGASASPSASIDTSRGSCRT